jgi:adenosylcobinamide-phosphate synthase
MLLSLSLWQIGGAVALGLGCDRLLGETRRFHPLVGLGWIISKVEHWLYARRRLNGVAAVFILSIPVLGFALMPLPWWLQGILLYIVLGGRSLGEHGRAVANALAQDDLPMARDRVGYIVSRKTATLDQSQVVSATIESMLENGNDAVFGALFWFIVAGLPGAVIYRIANTLDARWGYKNPKYLQFGWAAAKWDDVLNYIPARLCVLTYALQGHTKQSLQCAFTQGRQCASPNGGPVMASGAGALGFTIGGPAEYDGYQCDKPLLGKGPKAEWQAIYPAISLVDNGSFIWLLMLFIIAIAADMLGMWL